MTARSPVGLPFTDDATHTCCVAHLMRSSLLLSGACKLSLSLVHVTPSKHILLSRQELLLNMFSSWFWDFVSDAWLAAVTTL